jgi:2-keto-4-pentenoate hydratase/2-oxohepta-3-ene-1,7-dioic acid hydratase in catechol pathway
MIIATIKIKTPMGVIPRLCLQHEKVWIDVQVVWQKYFMLTNANNPMKKAQLFCPSSLYELLQVQDSPIEFFKETLEYANVLMEKGDLSSEDFYAQDSFLGKPLDHIGHYRDFYTHEKHVQTGFKKRGEPVPPEWYKIPAYYKGTTSNFIGPEEVIPWPTGVMQLDYELELAAVMGRRVRNASEQEVQKSLLGFTILNDVSARDWQRDEMKIRLGPSKSKDFCSVIGPVIVTADALGSNPKLLMTATVNGVRWSEGSSADQHYSWEEMIAYASKDEWIHAGDLMGSGTVGTGCGLELDRWIKPGDDLVLEIESIGKLRNKIGVQH